MRSNQSCQFYAKLSRAAKNQNLPSSLPSTYSAFSPMLDSLPLCVFWPKPAQLTSGLLLGHSLLPPTFLTPPSDISPVLLYNGVYWCLKDVDLVMTVCSGTSILTPSPLSRRRRGRGCVTVLMQQI